MNIHQFPKNNSWIPGGQDALLLSERKGGWQWYWVVATLCMSFILPGLMYQWAGIGLSTLSYLTNTTNAYIKYIADYNNIALLSDNIYSFLMFVVAGIINILTAVFLLAVHRRRIYLGLTFSTSFSWTPFWKAGAAYGLASLLTIGVYAISYSDNFTFQYLGERYFPLLCLAAIVILVQTLGEELLYRGYMFRVLGAVFPYRLTLVLFICALFTYEHINNPDIQSDKWFLLIVFFTTEVVFYWILLRTGSVMATWGMHWFNNLIAGVIITTQPGHKNDVALFLFQDPVLSKGGTYLYDPMAYLGHAAFLALFVALIIWKKSPFHLPQAV